ncbi:uncharacterized protein LOC126823958 isoform X2 [Patella vulgata]|uniref:uncharacterized protein LOC126823958 isoform X2 n=1 Tax=Patella vulgata TaxID=6465 RepID=UPI00217FA770|nr:uncharacterized protein LOC126823958 isoform X2 [Patella vulgata]
MSGKLNNSKGKSSARHPTSKNTIPQIETQSSSSTSSSTDTGPALVSQTETLQEIRVSIIGKTGVGKSALGNALLQQDTFKSQQRTTSVTSECGYGQRHLQLNGVDTLLKVVDTPGLFDTGNSNKIIAKEIVKCINILSPGPHLFIVVFRIDLRLSQEDIKVLEYIKNTFCELIDKFAIVVFTGKDQLDNQREEDAMREIHAQLSTFSDVFKHRRFATINNKDKTDGKMKDVDRILQLLQTTIQNNGGDFYKNEMYEEAKKLFEARIRGEEEDKQQALAEIDQLKKERDTWIHQEQIWQNEREHLMKECEKQNYQEQIWMKWAETDIRRKNKERQFEEERAKFIEDKRNKEIDLDKREMKLKQKESEILRIQLLERERQSTQWLTSRQSYTELASTSTFHHGSSLNTLNISRAKERKYEPSRRERGKMLQEDVKNIKDNYAFLLDNITDPERLSDRLFGKSVFDTDDMEKIKQGKRLMIRELLIRLLNGGPNSYQSFIDSLNEEGHTTIVEQLESKDHVKTTDKAVDMTAKTSYPIGLAIKQEPLDMDWTDGVTQPTILYTDYQQAIRRNEKQICDTLNTSCPKKLKYAPRKSGKMLQEDEKNIKDNYAFLLNNITDPERLSDRLFGKLVFDTDDMEKIKHVKGKRKMNCELVKTLLNGGPNSYQSFIDSLKEEGYTTIVEQLESSTDERCGEMSGSHWNQFMIRATGDRNYDVSHSEVGNRSEIHKKHGEVDIVKVVVKKSNNTVILSKVKSDHQKVNVKQEIISKCRRNVKNIANCVLYENQDSMFNDVLEDKQDTDDTYDHLLIDEENKGMTIPDTDDTYDHLLIDEENKGMTIPDDVKYSQTSIQNNMATITSTTPLLNQPFVTQDVITTNYNKTTDNNIIDVESIYKTCQYGTLDEVNTLIQKNLNVNICDGCGDTPLFYCVMSKLHPVEKIMLLYSAGAILDVKGGGGRSILHHVCEHGTIDCLKYLLEQGFDLDARDDYNMTSVFYCVMSKLHPVEKLKLLYSAGAILDVKNNYGLSLLDWVRMFDRTECESYLRELGLDK